MTIEIVPIEDLLSFLSSREGKPEHTRKPEGTRVHKPEDRLAKLEAAVQEQATRLDAVHQFIRGELSTLYLRVKALEDVPQKSQDDQYIQDLKDLDAALYRIHEKIQDELSAQEV